MSVFFYEPSYDFDRLFDEAFSARVPTARQLQTGELNSTAPKFLKPRMDLHEDAGRNTVTATFEFPGLQKEDVDIDIHNNVLSVSGEVKTSDEHEKEGYAIRERRYGKFRRTLTLPQGIKEQEIKATMKNGVLSVTFPKAAPEAAPKKIAVE